MKQRLTAPSITLGILLSGCMQVAGAVPLGEVAQPIKSSGMNPPSMSEAQLNMLGDTLDSIRTATVKIDKEFNRHEMVPMWQSPWGAPYFYDPDYDSFDGLAVNDMNYETYEPGHALLPRRDKLEPLAVDLTNSAQALKSQMAQLNIPPTAPPDLKAQWDVMQSVSASVQTDITKLGPLLNAPPYDPLNVGRQTRSLRDDVEGLDQLRKRVRKMIQSAS